VLKEFDLLTTCKVVLITNATCLHLTSVHEALDTLMSYPHGEIWAKLDAGTPEYYARMNRSGVPFERILSNLDFISKRIPVYIQSMFLKLNGQMMSDVELQAYMDRIKNLIDSGWQNPGHPGLYACQTHLCAGAGFTQAQCVDEGGAGSSGRPNPLEYGPRRGVVCLAGFSGSFFLYGHSKEIAPASALC
jgi:hypothetical protein